MQKSNSLTAKKTKINRNIVDILNRKMKWEKIQTIIRNANVFYFILFYFILFYFFLLLGLDLWHIEVPRLVVELELQLLTYTTAHSNNGFLTHWVRPGIEPAFSWILVGFVTHWATTGTPMKCKFFFLNTWGNAYVYYYQKIKAN